ncbi:MAG: hypothetical protein Q9159_004245 [Coniocarpon cinnabarinum]
MPVQLANAYPSSHMPSFPPTLEEEPDSILRPPPHVSTAHQTTSSKHDENVSQSQAEKPRQSKAVPGYPSFHLHRDSTSTTSTAASDSSTSSPTTTVSPAESYSNNNDTPITSPDTPASTLSLSSFTLANHAHLAEKPEVLRQPPAPHTASRPSTASKKPRNLKGLAVDTSSAATFGRALVTASVPSRQPSDLTMISAPASPAFVKPARPPKRKGSSLGLSIVTPASNSPPVREISEVPPTPSLVRPHVLRHFPSSPSLPLASPGVPPEGGMKLPPLATRRSVNVGFAEVPQEKDEDEPNYDVPQSAEPKPQAYPDGPICIYDPHVYLFYEPPTDVACRFDVVVNVASEVKNPFDAPKSAPVPDTKNAMLASSPTTPRAGDTPATEPVTQPEYVHIPWDHNTDIVPDLYDLVKLVDERVQDGKRVLIHCQLGVSRSASLIVAYGLFKNPSMTVQEAYDAVKRRSKWISPNMSLIMQLQEFRTELMKLSAGMPKRGISHRRKDSKGKLTALSTVTTVESPSRRSQDRDRTSEESGPRSAPLPPDDESQKALSITTDRDAVTPGPSSAPSGFSWPKEAASDVSHKTTDSPAPSSALPTSSLPTGSLSIPRSSGAPGSSISNISTPSLYSPLSQSSASSSAFSALQPHPPPAPFREPQAPMSKASPPHLKPLNLPLNHVSRFQSSNAGMSSFQPSPRSLEFGLNPAQPPTPDDTLGLTSPRVTTFQAPRTGLQQPASQPSSLSNPPALPLENKQIADAPDIPQRQPPKVKPIMPPDSLDGIATQPAFESNPPVEPLTSPRSSNFAMSGIGPPAALQNDDGLGLTSPRENLGFAQQMQLPHGRPKLPLPVPSAREKAFASLRSPTADLTRVDGPSPQTEQVVESTASDRRKLRSKLGMSTSSSYDIRSEYILAGQARQLVSRSPPPINEGKRESFHSALTTQDDMDALMSPRATEFTKNPFADALGVAVDERPQSTVVGPERGPNEEESDPRSPVQDPGSSPIVRNIADVFS